VSKINEMMEYNKFFNSLPKDKEARGYISGSMFIDIAREHDVNIPKYGKYIDLRREGGLSTSRKDFFKDILDMFSPDIQNLIKEECKVKN